MNNKIIYLVLAMNLLTACGNQSSDNSSQNKKEDQTLIFDNLVGLWKNEDGKSYERWTKNADGSYLSVGFQIKNGDTQYAERVHVHRENDKWVSENSVTGQNDGKAIKFMVTTLTREELHFSNPAHDFPTDIHYHLPDKNNIKAFIAGPNQSGGRDTIPFNFTRVVN